MNKSVLTRTLAQPAVSARVFTLAALLVLCVQPSYASQVSEQFKVLINLKSNGKFSNASLCRISTGIGFFGETVNVECYSEKSVTLSSNTSNLLGTAMQDGSYRSLTQFSKAGVSLGTRDIYAGGGSVTSWRVMSLDDRDYIELMVGW
jgi:hypothetical protein